MNITFNNYALQTDDIIVSDLQHEDVSHKGLNISLFPDRAGGRLNQATYGSRKISLKGWLFADSSAALGTAIDDMKRSILNVKEKNLDIEDYAGAEYGGTTRRYIATCSSLRIPRNPGDITAVKWEAEFIASNPPMGMSTASTTIEDHGHTFSAGAVEESTITGTVEFDGSFRPLPVVTITLNSCDSVSDVYFENMDGDGHYSRTRIMGYEFLAGDVISIDSDAGTVKVNGTEVEFIDGFPRFTLDGNSYTITVLGKSYDLDLDITYTALWL